MAIQPPWLKLTDQQQKDMLAVGYTVPSQADVADAAKYLTPTPTPTPTPKKRINIRQKGAKGERDIAYELNLIVRELLDKHSIPQPAKDIIQRNQNQTAVGGCDLSNAFGLAIEVKRQEQLSINKWWEQCLAQATRNSEFPVLLYRQNKGPWHVVINTWAQMPNSAAVQVRSEIEWKTFLAWFREWVDRKLQNGELPKT